MKIWIVLVCAYVLGVSAQSDEAGLPEYWADDYDDQWYQDELEKLGIVSNENKDSPEDTNNFNDYDNVGKQEQAEDEIDKKVEEEIQKFEKNDFKDDDTVNDYQVEDNRSDQKIEDVVEKKSEEKSELIHDNDDANNANDENLDIYDDYDGDVGVINEKLGDVDDKKVIEFSKDDDIAPLPLPPQSSDEIKQILEETKDILNEEKQHPNDFAQDSEETKENLDDMKDIIDETKQILQETNEQFDEEVKGDQLVKPEQDASEKVSAQHIDNDKEKKIDENLSDNIVASEEDSLDKAYQDLNEDLDTLFETLNKLANSEDTGDKVEPNVDYALNSDENVGVNNDYENIFDSNLPEIFSEHSKAMGEAVKEIPEKEEDSENESVDESVDDEIAIDVTENKPVPYVNDALVSDDGEGIKSVKEEDLTDEQLLKLMEDFPQQHSDALNAEVHNDNHIVNEITVEYGEDLVIESENYPSGYPTNRVVDWIITGKGVGIQLNVSDFAVNSALGDYLLVKPGQDDASGEEGLIFAYHLNQPRAYRFTDVDRIFLRFDAKNGFSFLRGFRLTVSMIAPLPSEPEPMPEPEPVLPEPHGTLALIIGGLTLQEFQEIKEDFRLLIADMATMYINANRIEPGMNTTAEITQITSAYVCNVHWPGYEQCAVVRVAVPLVYKESEGERLSEQELEDMWNTYVNQDPFAGRLRRMGVEEFSVPNDGGVLTVWLMVALGALVSAAMLALALWRYSCFRDYSRMPAFSDTDSLNEKRGLDLYPTPHQTLPPLYSEKEYKWDKYEDSTRVDVGGFANKSYVRTDMYDMESDEEVPRDRNTAIQPRDIYNV